MDMKSVGWGSAAFSYAALVFFLSSLSRFPDALPPLFGVDKVLHFIEYFVFGVLFYGWFSSFAQSGNRFPFWGAVIVGIAYAISDEWHQSFVPGRDASGWDVLFDSLGIYAASLTSPILLRKEKTS